MLGKDLLICNSGGTALIAASRSCEIQRDKEMLETASPTSGRNKTYIPGRKGWTITVNNLTPAPTVDLALIDDDTEVTVQVMVRGGAVLQGSALFQRCVVTGTCGNLAQGSFVLQGTGPLEAVTTS